MNQPASIDPVEAALAEVTTAARAPAAASRLAVEQGFNAAQTDNEWLIFRRRRVGGPQDPFGDTPARLNHTLEAAPRRQKAGLEQGGPPVMRRRLNAFFAISVNSPSMSMVNFCSCVFSAQNRCARGVTRRVAPQPMRAAVRMEAGAHACL